MALKNQALILVYRAWNASTGLPVTGDSANHTLRLIRDGVAAAPTNAPAEVDATNAPGEYSLSLTAAEMNANSVTLSGKSATANVVILGQQVITEQGRLDENVSAAKTLAANSVTASALAADAVTEIQTGLSTLTAAQVVAAMDADSADLDAIGALLATLEARLSEARAAKLDRDLAAVSDLPAEADLSGIETQLDAIQAKTALITNPITVRTPVTQGGDNITVLQGDSWNIPIDGLGDLSGVTKLWFAVKNSQGDADDDALLFIELADTGTQTIVIDDEAAGNIRIVVDETVTALLGVVGRAVYAIKKLDGGDAVTLAEGRFVISRPRIEAIS
jgi:hypothetical protein